MRGVEKAGGVSGEGRSAQREQFWESARGRWRSWTPPPAPPDAEPDEWRRGEQPDRRREPRPVALGDVVEAVVLRRSLARLGIEGRAGQPPDQHDPVQPGRGVEGEQA